MNVAVIIIFFRDDTIRLFVREIHFDYIIDFPGRSSRRTPWRRAATASRAAAATPGGETAPGSSETLALWEIWCIRVKFKENLLLFSYILGLPVAARANPGDSESSIIFWFMTSSGERSFDLSSSSSCRRLSPLAPILFIKS